MNKKVTAFLGSPRKLETYQVVREFEKNLRRYGDIDFEYVSSFEWSARCIARFRIRSQRIIAISGIKAGFNPTIIIPFRSECSGDCSANSLTGWEGE